MSSTQSMRRRIRAWTCLIVILVILVIWPVLGAAILYGWITYVMGVAYCYQVHRGEALERDLGFRLGNHYPVAKSPFCRMLAIKSVDANGVFSMAGFRPDDVLLGISTTEFFRLLHRHRGQSVELAVVAGGESGQLADRARRILRFTVPPDRPSKHGWRYSLTAIGGVLPFVLGALGACLGSFLIRANWLSLPEFVQILVLCWFAGAGFYIGLRLAFRNKRSEPRSSQS